MVRLTPSPPSSRSGWPPPPLRTERILWMTPYKPDIYLNLIFYLSVKIFLISGCVVCVFFLWMLCFLLYWLLRIWTLFCRYKKKTYSLSDRECPMWPEQGCFRVAVVFRWGFQKGKFLIFSFLFLRLIYPYKPDIYLMFYLGVKIFLICGCVVCVFFYECYAFFCYWLLRGRSNTLLHLEGGGLGWV